MQTVNRKALAENWGDDDKRRAAISSLFGKALTLQEEIGNHLLLWNDWIDGLRGAFEVQLTESQWQALVEGRKQLPNEPGSTYVLDKVKLCRKRSIPLTDAELISFLIRGLLHPGIQSVMMENISDSPVGSSASKETEKIDEKTPEKTRSTDSLFQAMEALTSQVAVLTHTVNRPSSPGTLIPASRQVTFEQCNPTPRNEIQCYNCGDFGHISRDCPKPNPRYPKSSTNAENGSAGPTGQGRQ
ncbi:hypothetical protein DAPPUDRAFT_330693 [Daphnia pulex]|uniref:CCHC-type domain-containing protein n=1 Tax=Daphnia pulex TaxID=6669 RepID=E9HKC7_DAPPU|nr:hypothetical protein DAPPUDRAFT_330693 [Daphnia pulex]|eukprot:EFX67803.1 hypothetical protein DAPPUDRAFT_330693 [Daphnia pulex]